MRPVIFVDRDGTIIEEAEYLSDPEKLALIPGAAAALRDFKLAGYAIAMVTNQSGVARGYFGMEAVDAVNAELARKLRDEGAEVDIVSCCVHHPDYTGPCECRKPAPGMLIEAGKKLDADFARSWMIGDKAADVLAGKNAGVSTALVLTGYGDEELGKLFAGGQAPDMVADTLADAAKMIISSEKREKHGHQS